MEFNLLSQMRKLLYKEGEMTSPEVPHLGNVRPLKLKSPDCFSSFLFHHAILSIFPMGKKFFYF